MLKKTRNHTKSLLFNKYERAKIVSCQPKPNYRVWIRFDDGLEGDIDLSHLVGKGVFKAWNSIEAFNQVTVNPKTDTLTWLEDIDLDPFVLREELTESQK